MSPGTDEAGAATAREVEVLKAAVAEAGALVMRYFGKAPRTWDKPGEGPVSEADLAANDLLRDRLCGAFPDHGWLSEESADDPARLSRERVWIVDPIDGTRAFIAGKSEFTVCAGLAVGGEVVAGAVLNPATDEYFFAVRGQGATLNDAALVSDRCPLFAEARMLSPSGVRKSALWEDRAPGGEPGYVNSIAYRVCKVATERWDTAIVLNRLSEWDLAAAHVILEEAGGRVTNRAGDPIRYNTPVPKIDGLVAAIDPLHGELVERLLPPDPAR